MAEKKTILKTSDQRMLDAMELLKQKGTIRFNQTFCDTIGLQKQNLVNIRKGTQYFTVDHITQACNAYNLNANWILGLSEELFREQAEIRFLSDAKKTAKPAIKRHRS